MTVLPRRSLAASAVVGAMVLATTPAGAAGAADDATEPAITCVTSVDDPALAVDTAAECGTEVEVASARTAWDTLYATPEGGSRVETSAGAVRTRASNGDWRPIDTALIPGDAGIEVSAPVWPMVFSDGTAGRPLATIERDGHVLEFDVPFELPAPQVEGPTVTYADVLPGVDLVASVNDDGTGFSEVLRVESPEAAAHPALQRLDFDVQVTDGLDVAADDGGFVATDGAGARVFTSPTPLMWDSGARPTATAGVQSLSEPSPDDLHELVTGEPATAEPVRRPAPDSVVAAMPATVQDVSEGEARAATTESEPPDAEASGGTVSVTPDAAMVADPETSWPIYIDPSVSGSRHEWTAIRSSISSDYKFSGDQGLGLCDVQTVSSCGEDFKSRLVWEFRDLGAIGNVAPGDITSATFKAYGTHSFNCTNYYVRAYRVENIASGTTWNSNSGWTDGRYQSRRSVHHKSGCPSSPGWVEWNVTDAAKTTASNNVGYLTIGLRAQDESSMSKWKRYRYDAKLSISYNRPPKTPWDLDVVANGSVVACGSGAWVRDTTPKLRARIGDPDGNRVYHNFNVRTAAGSMYYNGPKSGTSFASGSQVSRTVPSGSALTTGRYMFDVQAQDTSGLWGPWAHCSFNIDVNPPNTPTVKPVDGEPAVYVTDSETGGIGVRGKFAIGSNGSGDVKYFKYSFDDSTSLTKTLTGTSGTISYTPTTAGPHTLRVKSVDRAGNVSSIRSHTFDVAAPVEDAAWELNTGSGLVGEDFLGRQDLQLSSTAMWIDGPFVDKLPGNHALQFDDASDTAQTQGPVVHTDGSFVVSAHVRLDSFGDYAAAVSQNAPESNGFWLGYSPDRRCATDAGNGCWTFAMRPADGEYGTIVTTDFQVTEDKWMYLVGSYDATADEMKLVVCDPDPIDDDPFDGEEPEAIRSASGPFTTPWFAKGPLQLGRAHYSGTYRDLWRGAVDNVRVYDGQLLDAENVKVHRVCTGAPMYSTVPGGDINDPTEP